MLDVNEAIEAIPNLHKDQIFEARKYWRGEADKAFASNIGLRQTISDGLVDAIDAHQNGRVELRDSCLGNVRKLIAA